MTERPDSILRVLVVDDEKHIRTTLRACIEGEGHRVTTAGSSRDALSAASADLHHMAFVDLRLGVESGIELIPRLLDNTPSVKVIVITAHATVESAVEAMKCGATTISPSRSSRPRHASSSGRPRTCSGSSSESADRH